MRPKLFYVIVALLYSTAAFVFAYQYSSYGAIKQDGAALASGIMPISDTATTAQLMQHQEIEQQEDNMKLESYGYLAAAACITVIATVALFYRQRIVHR